jgi:branched-chain amino acid transport system permease protein
MTRIGRTAGAVTAVALLAISLPFVANSYFVGVGFTLLVWIALTESWIVISGMTGYISLGHVVFVGIGAYVAALAWLVLPIWIILPLAGLTAAVLATLVGYPCLRVRGPYFVILTFGLSELVKYIVVNIESALTVSGRVLFGAPGVETPLPDRPRACLGKRDPGSSRPGIAFRRGTTGHPRQRGGG